MNTAGLIEKFYTSFQNLDVAGMQSCYHDEIVFSDPVFPNLKGREANVMWRMLVESLKKGNDWKLTLHDVQANETTGSCRWEAHYTFSLTGRKVHNIIHAKFTFKEGKIIRHTDSFDFYRWARMAFGPKGVLLGWAPFFKAKVQNSVKRRLSEFMAQG